METGTIGSVVGITVICYLAALGIKATKLDNKWIPVICGVLGGILGLAGLLLMKDYPADDSITAAAIGIVSGLAATGSNQVYKQLAGNKNADSIPEDTGEDGGEDGEVKG